MSAYDEEYHEEIQVTDRAIAAMRRHYDMPADVIRTELESFYKLAVESSAMSILNVHLDKLRRGWLLRADSEYKKALGE